LGLSKPAVLDKPKSPVGLNQSAVLDKPKSPVGLNPKEVGLQLGSLSGVGVGSSLRQPPSASPSGIVNAASLPNQEKANPNPVGALSSQAKTKPKATPERCGNPDCLEPLVPGEEHVCWEEGSVKVKTEIVGFEVEDAE